MHTSGSPDGFSITRILPTSPDEVWDAWTEPDAMSQWLCAGNAVVPAEEIQLDIQIGGHYRYTMIDVDTGERRVTGGTYQHLDAPHRIAFTWGDYRADPEDNPLVVVSLEPHGEDTLMFFELRGASGAPGDHFYYDGWAEALNVLTRYFTTPRADG